MWNPTKGTTLKKLLTSALTVIATAGMTMGFAAEAQASIGYAVKTCYSGRAGKFTVSSWRNDANTQKTYHYRAETTNGGVTTVRGVYWLGVELTSSNSLVDEGYRYSSYLGTSTWKAEFQNYYGGVPTTKSSCSFSI